MREILSGSIILVAAAAAAATISATVEQTSAQTEASSAVALKTPWGDPDLQGIWTDETDTPLQRPAKYADQEFFTPEQRSGLDRARADLLGTERDRYQRGTARDVAGAYNSAFASFRRTGLRTSLIVDPPNGRLPPLTPQAQKVAAEDHEFRLMLLQATDTCMNKEPACAGGKYDPTPSSRYEETAPRYNSERMNRHNGPEDASLADRCLTVGLLEFGNRTGGTFRRIVQTPGGITMAYDVGQGQGFQRNIVMNGGPHLPANIRQWHGDSRGHWEGDTLVIDVTNFSRKSDFRGSRENLHVIERWTRTGPNTLQYQVTIQDPTVWTKPWTVREELTKQSDEENRFYTEPRCVDSNYGLAGLLHARRVDDRAFAEGRGPDQRTIDNIKSGFVVGADPVR
ncbi:MAG TPA: hypothetical protein VH684_15515 [Xanthobacteraceae bacterium]